VIHPAVFALQSSDAFGNQQLVDEIENIQLPDEQMDEQQSDNDHNDADDSLQIPEDDFVMEESNFSGQSDPTIMISCVPQ
jgi:hypothetical protein